MNDQANVAVTWYVHILDDEQNSESLNILWFTSRIHTELTQNVSFFVHLVHFRVCAHHTAKLYSFPGFEAFKVQVLLPFQSFARRLIYILYNVRRHTIYPKVPCQTSIAY